MPDLPYRSLVWLTYRLGATFALGVPLVLLIWAGVRREPAMVRLLGLYWKVASLLPISVLLLTDRRPIGYVMAFIAPVLMAVSVWFWVDLNEELADSAPGSALPLTVRIWRWALSWIRLACGGNVGDSVALCRPTERGGVPGLVGRSAGFASCSGAFV